MTTHALKLKYPIILVHGLGAKGSYIVCDYFFGLKRRLEQAGNRVMVASLSPWQTIEHRAAQLKAQIEQEFPIEKNEKVNLLAHSMGGLDARFLIARMGFAERVASLTTIGTTHRGSYLADLITGHESVKPGYDYAELAEEATESAATALATTARKLNVTARALRASHSLRDRAVRRVVRPIPLVLGPAERLFSAFGASARGLHQVTTKYCREEFTTIAPNSPDVAYFSAMTVIRKPVLLNSLPIFWMPHGVLYGAEGDNDGFVSAESARWGEEICTEYGDHYAQIGQLLGRARGGLDYVAFYDRILRRLKAEGF